MIREELEAAFRADVGRRYETRLDVRGHHHLYSGLHGCGLELGLRRGALDRGRLVEQLRHDDPMVRQGVVAALGQVATVEEVEPLTEVLRDPERMARMNAAQALGRLGAGVTGPAARARIVAGLVQALKDFDFGIRSYAVRSLSMIGDASAIGPLQALANDPEHHIREDAAKALLQLAESRHV